MAEERILKSPFKHVEIPNKTVWAVVDENCRNYKGRLLLTDASTGRSYTYGELHSSALCLARGLLSLGYDGSDVLVIYSPNCVEYLIMCLAVWRLNGTAACLNPMLSTDEIRHEVELLGSSFIVCHQQTVTTSIIAASGTNIKTQIVIGDGDYPGCVSFSTLCKHDPSWPTLPATGTGNPNPREHVPLIMFSSGTTGLPKGVMITDRNYLYLCYFLNSPDINGIPESSTLVYQPFSHIYGLGLFGTCVTHGKSFVLMQKFDLEEYIKLAAKFKTEVLHLVPPVAVQICKSGIVKKYGLTKVHTVWCGAAPLAKDVEQDLVNQFKQKVEVRQLYGMTETMAAGSASTSARYGHKPTPYTSVGAPSPNITVKIVDPVSLRTLGPEESGEIWINSEDGNMKGYFKNQEATKNTRMQGNWMRSGDIGQYDADGFIYVVDRLKEMIKYKGYQVAPAELEALLLTHPAVADCGVTGVPDREAGEVPLAWVVLKAGRRATEEEIQQLVVDKLAPYKKLRGGVKFVMSIPKSPSGKILRREIKRLTLEGFKSKL